jgi:hypothetical protein
MNIAKNINDPVRGRINCSTPDFKNKICKTDNYDKFFNAVGFVS